MCRSECCSTNGEDAAPSKAFEEMDTWNEFADGVSLFESYQEDPPSE